MLTAIDEVANQNHLQMLKAIIPYIPPPGQRIVSLGIKMMELQNVLSYYQRHDVCINACGTPPEAAGMSEILSDIRNYCEPQEQEMIDQMLRISSALELYSMLSHSGEEFSFSDLATFASGMTDPSGMANPSGMTDPDTTFSQPENTESRKTPQEMQDETCQSEK